jgi:S-formylglutathione hydrolase FrmB
MLEHWRAAMMRKRYGLLARWCLGAIVALLAPLALQQLGLAAQIANGAAALGFDAERVRLIEYLLLALLSGSISGLLLQQRSAAWIGSLSYFALRYLVPFIQQVQYPGLSPAGQPQVLIPGALRGVVLTLLGLAILCAGVGAATGAACGELWIGPIALLAKRLVFRSRRSTPPQRTPSVPLSLLSLLAGALVLGALLVSVRGADTVLMYGPTTNLYEPAPSGQGKPISSTTGAVPAQGTVLQGTYTSPALGGIRRTYWIYLPPSYTVEKARRYPTLYLLHGSPGTPADWFLAAHANTTADALIAAGKMRETIIVGADGNGPIYRFSEWANSFDGRQRMEDAIVQDLVPFIDHHYRTLADAADRAIGGNSMGGFGAMNIALHHPDVFGAVLSVGGYFQAGGLVFGAGPGSASYRRYNSPALFVQTPRGEQAARMLTFVIGIGTDDGHYYFEGIHMYQELLKLDARVQLLRGVGGHSWPFWARQLGQALPILEPPAPNL